MNWWYPIFYWIIILAWGQYIYTRESFTNPSVLEPTSGDAALESKIKALGPSNVNVAEYTSYLKTFYNNVYKTAPEEPTEQAVDTFLNGIEVSINPNDKAPLKEIIMEQFKIKRTGSAAEREAKQVAFTPSADMLGTETTEPNKGGPSPTDVGNTVMTDVGQIQPMGRGGSGAAQGLDAYNQDTPLTTNVAQMPPGLNLGTELTVQSALADVPVKTQEIQGPRIPKMGVRNPQYTAPKQDNSAAYPKLFGPDAAPKGGNIPTLTGNNALGGSGLATKSVGMPAVTLPDTPQVEPIPVLADFSKFFR